MKIVVASDSFKGGCSAAEACCIIAEGIADVDPRAKVVCKPMADGGEGTAAALMASRSDGKWMTAQVQGPLPRSQVDAQWAWFQDDGLAVIEMAAASGLPLLEEKERNPLLTNTYGTGELVRAAIEHGAARILLTIGGSATVDGGTGMAAALGWIFEDQAGSSFVPTGGTLGDIARIVPPDLLEAWPPVTVLCDVTNPLCGPLGAATVFGPQKGATPEMVKQLEAGLNNLAVRMKNDCGRDVLELPGGGAAGGLGAGAATFLNGELTPGIEVVMEASGLREALQGATWCITGEGCFDNQSLNGKVVSGVTDMAWDSGVPVVVFAGQIKVDRAAYTLRGISMVVATHAPDVPLAEVLREEREMLRYTAMHWAKYMR